MAVFKRGSVYWFEFRFRGVRIRESAHSSNKGIADRIERERRRDLELGAAGLKKISSPLSVSRAVEALPAGYASLTWADRTRGVHQSSWLVSSSRFPASCCSATSRLPTFRNINAAGRRKAQAAGVSTSKSA